MRGLTDADRNHIAPMCAACAIAQLMGRAGVPLPADLQAANPNAPEPPEAQEREQLYPATWTGYEAVLDTLRKQKLWTQALQCDAPPMTPHDVPIWSIVLHRRWQRVAIRVPRPAGANNYPYFVDPQAQSPVSCV